MAVEQSGTFHVALVGGGEFCREVLERYAFAYQESDLTARIFAVADPDPKSPGMILGKQMGLLTVTDYHDLYAPTYDIKAFVLLTPDESTLEDVLRTKPHGSRLVGYNVAMLFWKIVDILHQKIQARNEELSAILRSIQDFIVVITPDMVIQEVNQAFLEQMGYSRREVIGKKCHEIFQRVNPQCDFDRLLCPLNKVIQSRRPSQQILTRVDHLGCTRHVDVKVFPVWEKGGKISKFIEVSRDVTELKREEDEMTKRLEKMVEDRTRELKQTHAQLLHQDKMASLGKLSAAVVHEINNPISGILSLVMLMNRNMEDGPMGQQDLDQFSQYLQLIETETKRISRIVSNLLAFSRHSKMEFGSIRLKTLIEKTLFLNANLLKLHSVRVEEELDPNLPDLMGSEDRLQQVFMNLISNAVEAMESGGSGGVLRVKTGYLPRQDRVAISFSDTGIGIPPENLPKLFEPFFSTKKKGKGVGLGLSVAYGIIQEHGGSIQVQSEVGKGTTFTIELPLNVNQKQPSQ
jgi:two-component system NtrC family sensor kinase